MDLQTLKRNTNLNYIFLEMLLSSLKEEFMKEFQIFAPEIETDILTAYLDPNPNCSCRKKISYYINLYQDKCAEFLYNFVTKNNFLDAFNLIVEKSLNAPTVFSLTDISGKIAKTNIKDWEDFAKKTKNAQFRGFSVLKEGDDLLIFFL
jgi:hypothetical protein